jgi:hypothetical protein
MSASKKKTIQILIKNIHNSKTTIYDIYSTFKKMLDFCRGKLVEEELNSLWRMTLRVDEKEYKLIEDQIRDIEKQKLNAPNINVDIELLAF